MLCSKTLASFSDVAAIPVPEETATYKPVAHSKLIGFVKERAMTLLGNPLVRREQYGLAHDGAQLFSVLTLDVGDGAHGLSIGLRNSYNKTLSVGIASGAQVFVCDNLCFSGDSMRVVRKHTTNVWADLSIMVDNALHAASVEYDTLKDDFQDMQSVPVSENDGYKILGLAAGKKILRPQQLQVALSDWRSPRHVEFADRNAWSLYNCFTEGMKKGSAGEAMVRYGGAHRFFREEVLV